MTSPSIDLQQLTGEYAVARFPAATDPSELVKALVATASFFAVSRTPQELTIVCPRTAAPPGAEVDGP